MGAVETVTIGADTFNVYGLGNADPVGDADTYFAARLGATSWTAATSTTKAQALVSGARMLDRRAIFTGTKTSAAQPLQWPRNSATACGVAVADGTVPDDIALAQFELALALLVDADIQNTANTGSNVKAVRAGSASVEFFNPTYKAGAGGSLFPQPVMELVGCYLTSRARLAVPIVDGTNPDCVDESTHFDSGTDSYGLSGGL